MQDDWKFSEAFSDRHNGPDEVEQKDMLRVLKAASLDALVDATIPASIRLKEPLRLPGPLSEQAALAELAAIAGENEVFRSFIGAGYSDCITPPVVRRNVLENPAWYTAYTPYQAEIAQGRLEALLNFQTMVCDLTGLPVANASLLDEATAAAEAMVMLRASKDAGASDVFLVASDCHPQTLAVVRTRALALGIEVVEVQPSKVDFGQKAFGLLLQYPGTDGAVRDDRALVERARAAGTRVVVAADLMALALLTPPGEWGADIVVGNTQRFGVPMGYGGPHAAYLATHEKYVRLLPGRIIGVSQDARGKPALRMALQTREQHIRREKATSNICTAQVLLAVIASMFAVYHGPDGIRRIARRIHGLTRRLAAGLERLGVSVAHKSFFDTLTVALTPARADAVQAAARRARLNFRRLSPDRLSIALDEVTAASDLEAIWAVFRTDGVALPTVDSLALTGDFAWDGALTRKSAFLTHPVFHAHRSETEMLRYIKRLETRDFSLVHGMIPLGSCTMKLNATAEMLPITWPTLAQMHPFVPTEQAKGYARIFKDLENWLGEITGLPGVSLQPNAGSQGEYAGLWVIRRFHESRGQGHRKVCLIPSSAHGTNPASAVMAGMRVVVVKCDERGNVELDDLVAKAEAHKDELGALMVTYPSTHGVFEEDIQRICEAVHARGGQVYMDGANMNAQVGLTRPGAIGADVCHLNLHKTFCIPHGGGGPGMGPIAVAKHLTPFLPTHPVVPVGTAQGVGAISAAPWGSANILVISWMYIRMMGGSGLRDATRLAILNANYMAERLSPHYPVLYRGAQGRVAHECILDLRPLKKTAGIEVEDVAKRLMDYGFHAPTVSFPVAGTLMVEPTESESKVELDRFCDALIAIREEIAEVEAGRWPKDNNPLVHAPHTQDVLAAAEWNRPYSRERAAFPSAATRESKFWPSVGRLNSVFGDRNLVCSCPPVDSYAA